MAKALWDKVYYKDDYAGLLQQEPGGRYVFTYDAAYVAAGGPAIAHTLPLREEPHYCHSDSPHRRHSRACAHRTRS